MNPSTLLRCSLALGTLVLLSACGGGGSSAPPVDPPPPPPPPPQVGQLLDVQPLGDISRRDIADAIADSNRIPTSLAPRYGVTTYRLSYLTQDKDGALVRASGLVALPVRPAGATPSAVLSYQHATTFENAYAPSVNLAPAEPPLVLASLGYIVVASDYVGFADSQGLDHPYLQADATARAVLDMLTAAQRWRSDTGVPDNGQLYLVGYSEGGYATMAAQREIERAQLPWRSQLRASIPGAGPYDMQALMDAQLARVRDENPVIGWMLNPGTLSKLGATVRAEVRRLLLRLLIPKEADVNYDARFLDDYLADDQEALYERSSVHWGWTPSTPVHLFHGRDDSTVPFVTSESAYDTLRAREGAARVTLRECVDTQPSEHTACVPEYFGYVLQVIEKNAP